MSFYECDGYPIEDYDLFGHFTPTRQVHCPWNERYTTIAAIDDLEYPYRPNCGAYPQRMRIEPMTAQNGSPGQASSYESAKITIWYSSAIRTNAAIVETLAPTREILPMDAGALYDAAGLRFSLHRKPFLLLPGAVFSHVRMKTGVVPNAVISQVGCVNASSVYAPVLDMTFAAETLLALTPKMLRTYTVSGITNYFVEQEFLFCSNGGLGWNAALNAATGNYEYYYDESGNRLRHYALAAFTLL